MKKIFIILITISILFLIVLAVFFFYPKQITNQNVNVMQDTNLQSNSDTKVIQNAKFQPNPKYNNQEVNLKLTFSNGNYKINDQVVPKAIRVAQNTNLTVNVKNNSNTETSVHFHGVNGLSKMDGVGNITQDPIKPGESFKYQFVLDNPGTYMYHAHMDSANQVNNENLFGGLVVENQTYLNQQMLIFNSSLDNIDEHHNANLTFDHTEINGQEKLEYNVNNNENIFINLVNMSSTPMSINFGNNVTYRILDVDANKTTSDWLTSSLIVPTANRLTIEIKNPKQSFEIKSTLNNKKNAVVTVNYKNQKLKNRYQPITDNNGQQMSMMGSSSDITETGAQNLYSVITSKDDFNIDTVNKKFKMTLAANANNWVINDKAFPNTKTMDVNTKDFVEVQLTNTSHMSEIHPFHLHGHEFQVVQYNNKPINKNLILDTVQVMPGDSVTIRFKANNPGIWAFHCHDLTHAAKGMMTTLNYNGYKTNVKFENNE